MPENYRSARKNYLNWYSHLLSPLELENEGQDPLNLLENRLEALNFASEALAHATQPLLHAEIPAFRLAAADSLLHQIEADLAIAQALWLMIDGLTDDLNGFALIEKWASALRASDLRAQWRDLSSHLAVTIDQVAQTYQTIRPNFESPPQGIMLEVALLAAEAQNAVEHISQRTSTVGLRLVRDILAAGETDWKVITYAIDILQGHQHLADVGWGFEDQVSLTASGLAGGLRATLTNVILRILLIIEDNDLVRYTISDWLTQLHEQPSPERKQIFETLLEQLYQARAFCEKDLPIWLQDALQPEPVHRANERLIRLTDNFERFSNRIKLASSRAHTNLALQQSLFIEAGMALQVGLLAMLVFSGYDFTDEGAHTLNLAEGVKQILIEELPVSRQTIELAENIRLGIIR